MPKQRVFVSSVVEGFGEFRDAARRAILQAGGEPVLVNEDFPSLHASPRNACLDAVDSCDIYVGIIGERGGWVAPSGKLVVEEEWERAKAKRLRVLFFLQEVPRDAVALRLVQRVSDYVDGTFRRTFNNPEDLRSEIVKSLTPLIEAEVSAVRPPEGLLNAFPTNERFSSHETLLRTWIAPERAEEVIDPVQIGDTALHRALLAIGHRDDVNLLDYENRKNVSLKKGVVTIEEEGSRRGTSKVRLGLNEKAVLSSDIELSAGNETMLGLILAVEDIELTLRCVMRFYAGVMDYLDPYKRHHRFFYNVGLLNLGYRSLERNPKPRTGGITMPMRNGGPIVAHDTPRIISRDDLTSPDSEIQRVITLITRQAADGS